MTPAAAGLILAAGAGRRFGPDPKLLAELGGRPLLEHAVEALTAVPELEPVLVVLGAQAELIRDRVEFGRARVVQCPGWSEGLSASLRCGVAALPGVERVLVALGDAPGLTAGVVRRLLGAAPGTRAAYAGEPGHPVLLGAEQLSRISRLRGDVGARELLRDAPRLECGDLATGADVDTRVDLEALRR